LDNQFRTIIISDVHLGAKGSKSKELNNFLKQYKCDHLIINGDIIDSYKFNKQGILNKKFIRLYNRLLKLIKDNNTKITLIIGNHDATLLHLTDFQTDNFQVVKNLVLPSGNKNYFVLHGDIYDAITCNFRWLARLGKAGYRLSVWLGSKFPRYQSQEQSFSTFLKLKFGQAMPYVREYEQQLTQVARLQNCDGVICGHSHIAAIKNIEGIEYLNSGDWMDSLSALTEDHQGEWSLTFYNEAPKIPRISRQAELKSKDIVNLKQYRKASNL